MKKASIKQVLSYVLPCILFSAMIVWLLLSLTNVFSSTKEKELSNLKATIENSITMCYAIEGAYPKNIGYLRDNYGLVYDNNKYIVHYEVFASNVRPNVKVLERQADGEEL